MRNPPTGLSAGHTAKGKLQRACLAIIRRMAEAGEVSADKPTNARFVYYVLKQGGYPLVKHAKGGRKDDQDTIDAVKHLRDIGAVPWDWISDETRDVSGPIVAPTIVQWLIDAIDQKRARIDPWPEGQRPMIICETRGVRSVLDATAREYGALITSTNGQAGGFLHTDVMPGMTWQTPVAYFGDWNPAGSAIETGAFWNARSAR